jgi:hypothetical protein
MAAKEGFFARLFKRGDEEAEVEPEAAGDDVAFGTGIFGSGANEVAGGGVLHPGDTFDPPPPGEPEAPLDDGSEGPFDVIEAEPGPFGAGAYQSLPHSVLEPGDLAPPQEPGDQVYDDSGTLQDDDPDDVAEIQAPVAFDPTLDVVPQLEPEPEPQIDLDLEYQPDPGPEDPGDLPA